MSKVVKAPATRRATRSQRGMTPYPLENLTSSLSIVSSSPSSQDSNDLTNVSSPATSPIGSQSERAPYATPTKQRKSLTQSHFSFGAKDKKTCTECGMSYMQHIPSDVKLHNKHHKVQTLGREWKEEWGSVVMTFSNGDCIMEVKAEVARAKTATLELMEVVNTELNAPDDNEFWIKGTDSGVVYVYVVDGICVGLVSVEKVKEGRWFSLDDGRIVSTVPLQLMVGINRVYVARKYRRQGIALRLLTAVRKYTVYGMDIPKEQIAWSQPSFSGSKLAAKFNARRHKSGKVLIPVYT